MREIKDIYPTIIAKENLYRSAYAASRGRRYRDSTADFNFHLEEEIGRLHRELAMKNYRHGKYRVFTIYDPKERQIAAAPFRDRVVHHAVHDIIEPIIDKTFIYDSYACRKNKGTHKAIGRAQGFLKENAFCLHGDIKKYFYSIDREILKELLRGYIADIDLLWLLDGIVDSAVTCHCEAHQKDISYSSLRAARDLPVSGEAIPRMRLLRRSMLTKAPRNDGGRGLPIGNLTSQFFANLYLNELDYFVKSDLRCRYYIRYMDDFLIFGSDRDELRDIKDKVRQFLRDRLNLTLHEGKSQIFRAKDGIKFLGFRIYRDYRRLTTDNVRRFRKRLKKFSGEWSVDSDEKRHFPTHSPLTTDHCSLSTRHCSSVRCWVAHAKYADTYSLRLKMFDSLLRKDHHLAGLIKDVLLGERLNA